MKNIGSVDRFLRAFFGVVFLELAYFWLAGGAQIAACAVAAILLLTAVIRLCPLYRIFGVCTARAATKCSCRLAAVMAWVLLAGVIAGGSYASAFFTRKMFMADFNAMNDDYKQALFLTGKNEREKALAAYERLIPGYRHFQEKYSSYTPFALSGDSQFKSDLERVAGIVSGVNDLVRNGDLQQAHLALEQVRPVFQNVFKRNGFSLVSVALVDFHDAMELMLEAAGAKDQDRLVALYPQVSERLKSVEAEAGDVEIQAIRKNLDDLYALAKNSDKDALVAKRDELKNSFVKVYLKRG